MTEKTLEFAHHKCQVIYNLASGVPVVFLHGFSFTSDVWQRTSVTELLREKRVSFLALDMPYGLKSRCQPKTRDEEVNVGVVREAVQNVFGASAPVLVGASIGGHVALKCAARFPVKGLLLLGPTRVLEESLVKAYSQFRFPVHIIYGSEDRIASHEELRELVEKLPNAKLKVYEGAGHAAYLNNPGRFKQDLLELYAIAEQ